MKTKSLVLVSFTFIVISLSYAQTSDYRFSIGFSAINNEYKGDYGNGLWNFSHSLYPGVGMNFSYYLNSSFNIGLEGSYGNYGFYLSDIDRFNMRKLDANFLVDYKFNNGYILNKEDKFYPFLTLGAGIATYNDKFRPIDERYISHVTKGYDIIIPVGFGLKYQLSDRFAVQYKYLYNFTNRNIRDENRGAGVPIYQTFPGNDRFGKHVVSFSLALGKCDGNL